MSAETSLLKFMSSKTPDAAINVMVVCAANGEDAWKSLIDAAMARTIACDPPLWTRLLNGLCKQPGLPDAHVVLDGFLSLLTPAEIAPMFAPELLKKRGHPAVTCFYNASFPSPSGINITKTLAVLIKHGLPLCAVATKNMSDLERAASFGHRAFLKLVIPSLPALPEEIVRAVLCKSMYPMESISILVDDCGISLDTISPPRLLAQAKPEARSYIHARRSRAHPIPETVFDADVHDEVH